MEVQEGAPKQPSRFSKLVESAKNLLKKKKDNNPSTEEFKPRKSLDLPTPDLEAIHRSFDVVKRLVESGRGLTGKINVGITEDGKVDFKDTQELMLAQESLDLSDVNKGDVVWWRSIEGRTGYYSIIEEYDIREGNENKWKFGSGVLRLELPDGVMNATNATIQGAGYGSMRAGCIARNLPIILVTEFNGPGAVTMTTEIKDFGVIKAESLKNL